MSSLFAEHFYHTLHGLDPRVLNRILAIPSRMARQQDIRRRPQRGVARKDLWFGDVQAETNASESIRIPRLRSSHQQAAIDARCYLVPLVEQRAQPQGQAATAYAAGQVLFQLLQHLDPLCELIPPIPRQAGPVRFVRRASVGKRIQR